MFDEDLSAFFNPTEFADLDKLGGVDVPGIFDSGYDETLGMAVRSPSVLLPDSSVPPMVVGLLYIHKGTTYKVVEPLPADPGLTRLHLRK